MYPTITFMRIVTSIIIFTFTTLSFSFARPLHSSLTLNICAGLILSTLLSSLFIYLDNALRKFHLRVWGTVVLGLFLGIFLGKALGGIFDTLIISSSFGHNVPSYLITIPKALLYLLGIHLGLVTTLTYEKEIHISIPFVRFDKVSHDKKDIILDDSILSDPRSLDFLATGILNGRLILPGFLLRDMQEKLTTCEEHMSTGIRKAISIIEKLKTMKNLDIKENETDFADITDIKKKIYRLAKLTHSNILTAECSKLNNDGTEVAYIDLGSIANSLKNIMMAGESIEIKVQRFGKEPKQGVGYLEDGTMVVINNGGNFIGEVIETQVISVKQTSAGRIIFTNAMVEEEDEETEYAYESQPAYEHHNE